MAKIGSPNAVRPLHYWSQKVLPLVYDDSLSYYEVLGKITHKLNDVIVLINNHLDEYIREQLDNLFIDAIYDPETETLILTLGIHDN